MEFMKALEISKHFQESYETLARLHGSKLKEKAKPYLGVIKAVMTRKKCNSVEAVLGILKRAKGDRVPLDALTLWLLASAVILEEEHK